MSKNVEINENKKFDNFCKISIYSSAKNTPLLSLT